MYAKHLMHNNYINAHTLMVTIHSMSIGAMRELNQRKYKLASLHKMMEEVDTRGVYKSLVEKYKQAIRMCSLLLAKCESTEKAINDFATLVAKGESELVDVIAAAGYAGVASQQVSRDLFGLHSMLEFVEPEDVCWHLEDCIKYMISAAAPADEVSSCKAELEIALRFKKDITRLGDYLLLVLTSPCSAPSIWGAMKMALIEARVEDISGTMIYAIRAAETRHDAFAPECVHKSVCKSVCKSVVSMSKSVYTKVCAKVGLA
jgi:hypothetical protein